MKEERDGLADEIDALRLELQESADIRKKLRETERLLEKSKTDENSCPRCAELTLALLDSHRATAALEMQLKDGEENKLQLSHRASPLSVQLQPESFRDSDSVTPRTPRLHVPSDSSVLIPQSQTGPDDLAGNTAESESHPKRNSVRQSSSALFTNVLNDFMSSDIENSIGPRAREDADSSGRSLLLEDLSSEDKREKFALLLAQLDKPSATQIHSKSTSRPAATWQSAKMFTETERSSFTSTVANSTLSFSSSSSVSLNGRAVSSLQLPADLSDLCLTFEWSGAGVGPDAGCALFGVENKHIEDVNSPRFETCFV